MSLYFLFANLDMTQITKEELLRPPKKHRKETQVKSFPPVQFEIDEGKSDVAINVAYLGGLIKMW